VSFAALYWDVNTDFDRAALTPTTRDWYDLAQQSYAGSGWQVGFTNDLYEAARTLWFHAAGPLTAFLATGSKDMLVAVNGVAERVLQELDDYDADGYRELVYESSPPAAAWQVGTDDGMDANLLAAWLTCVGYLLDRNRAHDEAFGATADAIADWLFNDYLPEVESEPPGGGKPLVPDDLTHCWARGALWLHFLEKWTGYGAYDEWLSALKATVFNDLNATFLERPNGSLVWDHRPANHPNTLGLHPSIYAGDTLISLVLLAADGALDAALLPKLAKTVTHNIFGGEAAFPGAYDVGGGVVLEGEPFKPEGTGITTTITEGRFSQTGFPALMAWDDSGIIAALVAKARAAGANGMALSGWMVFGRLIDTLP